MPGGTIAKRVYGELNKLHSMGFTTWVTRVNEVITIHGMDITKLPSNFRMECKNVVITQFITQWDRDMQNIGTCPILRTYDKFKSSLVIEPYLYMKNRKYWVAVAQLRTSPHTLAIERGRYSRLKVQICDRTCNVCGILEDETHFLIHCSPYKRERGVLFSNVLEFHPGFSDMSDENKFIFLLGNTDQQVLTWMGKFIYKSLKIRTEELL